MNDLQAQCHLMIDAIADQSDQQLEQAYHQLLKQMVFFAPMRSDATSIAEQNQLWTDDLSKHLESVLFIQCEGVAVYESECPDMLCLDLPEAMRQVFEQLRSNGKTSTYLPLVITFYPKDLRHE